MYSASHISEASGYIMSMMSVRDSFTPLMLQWELIHGLFHRGCGPSLVWSSTLNPTQSTPLWDFPGGPWRRLCTPNAGDLGSIRELDPTCYN